MTTPVESLFEYVILFIPNEQSRKSGNKALVLVGPKQVLSTKIENAQVLAARDIPADYVSRLDEVQVVVRPF